MKPLYIRLTDNEHKSVMEAARDRNMSLQAFCASVVLQAAERQGRNMLVRGRELIGRSKTFGIVAPLGINDPETAQEVLLALAAIKGWTRDYDQWMQQIKDLPSEAVSRLTNPGGDDKNLSQILAEVPDAIMRIRNHEREMLAELETYAGKRNLHL